MKRLSRLGGLVVGIGAGVAAAAWLKKNRPATVPAAGTAPAPRPAAGSPRARVAQGDDLTLIKGIGPVYAERLAAAGFGTFAELAAADSDAVAAAAGIGTGRAAEWVAAAADHTG